MSEHFNQHTPSEHERLALLLEECSKLMQRLIEEIDRPLNSSDVHIARLRARLMLGGDAL